MRSRRPPASARSMSAASRLASAEADVSFAAGGLATGWTFRALAARALAVRRGALRAGLGEDIELVPFLDQLVLAQLELAVGNAFAGLHVVFVAVPGTDEMHLGVGEVEALGGLVG